MVWMLLVTTALSSCAIHGLAFEEDNRLHFVQPRGRQQVTLPVTISWNIADFVVAGPGHRTASSHEGYFAVFVDRAPIRPDQTLRAVAGNDETCLHDPQCPDQEYLASRGVYVTTNDTVVLPTLPALSGRETNQLHEVTVVLMNSAGHRIGESAWYIDFWLRRQSLS
jgi:hypothetical protein